MKKATKARRLDIDDDSDEDSDPTSVLAKLPPNPKYTQNHIESEIVFDTDKFSHQYGRPYYNTRDHKNREANRFLWTLSQDLSQDNIEVYSTTQSFSTFNSWHSYQEFLRDEATPQPQMYHETHHRNNFGYPSRTAPFDYGFIKKLPPFEKRKQFIHKKATHLKAANASLRAREDRKAARETFEQQKTLEFEAIQGSPEKKPQSNEENNLKIELRRARDVKVMKGIKDLLESEKETRAMEFAVSEARKGSLSLHPNRFSIKNVANTKEDSGSLCSQLSITSNKKSCTNKGVTWGETSRKFHKNSQLYNCVNKNLTHGPSTCLKSSDSSCDYDSMTRSFNTPNGKHGEAKVNATGQPHLNSTYSTVKGGSLSALEATKRSSKLKRLANVGIKHSYVD